MQILSNIKLIKTDLPDKPARYLSQRIEDKLKNNKSVAWFLSGGSAIAVALKTAKFLRGDMKKLTVILADERYGEPGHAESNWSQLQIAGFNIESAHLVPVLTGQTPYDTRNMYENAATKALEADYTIALLGMGADGHTAGILPDSPAVNSTDMVSLYETPQFKRLTLTPTALEKLDEAIVYAQGETKRQALNCLKKDMPLIKQPAQVLKRIPHVTVYNDLEGED